jgi:outer membrane lipoprotein-sorting protein
MRMMPSLIITLALLLPAFSAGAQDPVVIIGNAAAAQYTGNSVQSIELTQTLSSGQTKVHTADIHTRVVNGATDSHAIVRTPINLARMQLLSTTGANGSPVVWLFMPEGGNLLQITGANRKGPFLGSDFSYEDLALGNPAHGTHALLGTEPVTVAGTSYTCDKVETTPLPAIKSQYARIVTWIEQGTSLPRRIDLLDANGAVIKRMTFEAFAVQGGIALPTRIRMENLKKGSNTLLEVTSHQLNATAAQLPAALFTPTELHTVQ